MGLPFEHGLHSTLIAMRLAERLGVDSETAFQTYYGCLLFYVGCTADAEITAELFEEGALLAHFTPVMFGTAAQTMAGIARALTSPGSAAPMRAMQVAGRLPRAVRGHRQHLTAMCQVAQMLCDRLGMPSSVRHLFVHLTERWDGKGEPSRLRGTEIPLALRIIHVARDAAFQGLLGDEEHVSRVIRSRAGGAFDPAIAACLADHVSDVLMPNEQSAWTDTVACEPIPGLKLRGGDIDQALAAMADFADLISPYLVGHSAGVAELATAAAQRCGFAAADVVAVRRAAFVHDIGRVAVPASIWQKPGPLTTDEWERVRLHAYHSERVICRSPFLATLAPIASSHHERLDGSGYHRGATAAVLTPTARLLAASDAYHTKIEPRPHRGAVSPQQAAEMLGRDANTGRLDADSVAAVLEAAGHRAPRMARPAGLTDREAQVVGLLARGMQTKQIARALGISAKTADRHVQNTYAKIGVSTRAAAAVFAMQHGLIAWGELPIANPGRHS
jgi:HD-GYP domain-containing protein (c-di-GMP phosphodiesterase class II)